MKKLLSYVIRLSILLSLFACSNKVTEMRRVSNTSRSIDAVIAIKETGATVATPTEIYLVPNREKVKGDPIFRADNVEGLTLAWDGESKLIIRAEKARVFLQSETLKVDVPGKQSQAVSVQVVIKDLR
jgi:hypothetical protein